MKCVRVVGQGVPVRMTDADAHQLVHVDGDGEYCTKTFWKQWHAANGTQANAYYKLSKART